MQNDQLSVVMPGLAKHPPVFSVDRVDSAHVEKPLEFITLGERHRLQIEAMAAVLPELGLHLHLCGRGLRSLSQTLAEHVADGLLLIEPSRGLIAALRESHQLLAHRPLLIVTPAAPTAFYLRDCLRLPVTGLLANSDNLDELTRYAREAVRGNRNVSRSLQDRVKLSSERRFNLVPADDLLALTGRQLEVVRLTAIGSSTRDIAERLNLSPKTVESHRYRAMRKLQVHDRVELTRRSLSEGLLR